MGVGTFRIALALALLGAGLPHEAWAGDDGGGHVVIHNIALSMVVASVVGLFMKVLRQPLILGYLISGIIIGPVGFGLITNQEQILTVAEIGLILLLFMIGLEIDLKRMLSSGRLVLLTGALQFPISVLAGLGFFHLLAFFGLGPGGGYAAFYSAIAIGISSTMVVVKLLYDKKELDTLPGRITVGILVFQDLWAIILLAVQPNFSNPQLSGILRTFGSGASLVVSALLVSRFILPRVFRFGAKVPELMLILSMGWCFLVSLVAAHPQVGLSMEMGALIAGVSLATFPYNLDVIAKVISIRDFFITLFFVALGMQIPLPEIPVLGVALMIIVGLILSRVLGVFTVLHLLRAGHRTSLTTAINLTQISEFALVILSLGITFGHISAEVMAPVLWAFSFMAVASTYLVGWSHVLQQRAGKLLVTMGVRDIGDALDEILHRKEHPIVILGFFRIASALVAELERTHQHLLEEILVVDFNPLVHQRLSERGIPCIYGDIGHSDTMRHVEIEHARVALCTVPDSVLKGVSNLKLLRMLKELCPNAHCIMTAENLTQAQSLYADGADYVLMPSVLTGESLVNVLELALHGTMEHLQESHREALSVRKEILFS
ncbi:MAG: cation:proton antiporter [Magnetococcales bacterium]|nr:cation:proton antiporter [Magnetococcales bacterium]